MRATWSFSARPLPVTALLTSAGEYSSTRRPLAREGDEQRAARLGEDDHRARVDAVERLLQRGKVGPGALQELVETVGEDLQPIGDSELRRRRPATRGDRARRAGAALDESVSRVQAARVESENEHEVGFAGDPPSAGRGPPHGAIILR